ncbi:C39 family peptidase [Paenibacillus sp. GSMTC-2017]|uniref:C39 family peptidase n=1 Tax=Paenibacillus sp. GSMTC-2017 TaxID=2794350 RepID=UPI0018D86D53|nr:C39 family peptidase [Paenibacillus sp. GSMTC-2017]MBH5320510.1 C39 family peptidase [Paenibacillus sp. GSMTC-2017]
MKKQNKKRSVQLLITSLLIIVVVVIYSQFANQDQPVGLPLTTDNQGKEKPAESKKPKLAQGKITFTSVDADTGLPIANTEFAIIEEMTSAIIETVRTDSTGKATSGLFNYGTSYKIKQVDINAVYEPNEQETRIEISAPSHTVDNKSKLESHIKDVVRKDDGTIEIKSVYMNVDTIMQKPELPNGCEITSLTAVLNYYGYDADKLDMADNYLPKQPWTKKNGKLYGADPYKAYAGDPREQPGGFFSYAPPIIVAAEKYLSDRSGVNTAEDISGSSRSDILQKLNSGIPVVTWITLDLSPPKVTYSWYLNETNEKFKAPVNLHVVVLNGYDATSNTVNVMNPLTGQVTYNADTFFNSYVEMGSHALIVKG